MVPPSSDRISRVPPYFSPARYHIPVFAYRAFTFYGRAFQPVLLTVLLSLDGCSDFARHYFRNLGLCLFLGLLRCFSSPGSPRAPMYLARDTSCEVGFPLPISPDQCSFASSPELFAGLHVFRRL